MAIARQADDGVLAPSPAGRERGFEWTPSPRGRGNFNSHLLREMGLEFVSPSGRGICRGQALTLALSQRERGLDWRPLPEGEGTWSAISLGEMGFE
jgi:hypothetical protein